MRTHPALLTALILTLSITAHAERLPNIVWIWADNLAYGDLSLYGNTAVKTPAIDRLAEEGVRFDQFYVAHTVCSPSRAALLTGRQPFRVGIVDVLRPDGPSGLPDDEITLAELLRERGYATAAFGKWHLGDRPEYLPLQHGFDRYLGLPYSMDMLPTVLYRDNEIVGRLDGDKVRNVTERLADGAIEFMKENTDRPFFVYFSHTLPHPPLNLPPEHTTPDRAIYDDAIEHMDLHTGRMLDAIDALGLRENTLVVFTSDNGPMAAGGKTGGLRGRIRDAYEGGVRVPFVARFPNRIPARRVVDEPAIMYDIFPTVAALTGATLPNDRPYDGQDIRALLTGKDSFTRNAPFIWVYFDNPTAIRDKNWKLHIAHREKVLPAPELYDLTTDPDEATSLTDQHPEVAARLQQTLTEFQKDIPKVWPLRYPVRDPEKRPSGVRRK
jgi:arylsulfatase A-like enzyme